MNITNNITYPIRAVAKMLRLDEMNSCRRWVREVSIPDIAPPVELESLKINEVSFNETRRIETAKKITNDLMSKIKANEKDEMINTEGTLILREFQKTCDQVHILLHERETMETRGIEARETIERKKLEERLFS